MKDTRTHDEDGVITPGAKLSGNNYVVVRLREGDDPPARILLVRNPSRCHHGYTMCVECADSWELDHHVDYELTGGGRWLRAALDTQRAAPASKKSAEDDSGKPGTEPADSTLAHP
ncbi:hypothetical protein [Nocardia puris]|uniref:Uncharacterized protein n=1 Tax=Nocardia puris TaxID=208602 RepID=A0A366CU30_9NOCA|nr:hypothetical protein [Nocardia puris]RBO79813.1 hypothetical protein DFR74_1318 [Nocardia puris]